MREVNDQLRGLLKKPNRPPSSRKNRVAFDETRNEFFEADYIILIREDCAYDEEDEEPCTCSENEFLRLCCEEGCQCNYSTSTAEECDLPQIQNCAAPQELNDGAAVSPPDGYKDSNLRSALEGVLSSHIFGSQHLRQLQVIQKLQQQRAAMLAAFHESKNATPQLIVGKDCIKQHHQEFPTAGLSAEDVRQLCTECAECIECATKKLNEKELNIEEKVGSQDFQTLALLPRNSDCEDRRKTQKEIVAGEERPKYILEAQFKPSPERRFVGKATDGIVESSSENLPEIETTATLLQSNSTVITCLNGNDANILQNPASGLSTTQKSGILKGGKLWKQDSSSQSDDHNTTASEDESGSIKRSVRFTSSDSNFDEDVITKSTTGNTPHCDNHKILLIPIKKHSTLFNNALRPNSASRQLFPKVTSHSPTLISDTLGVPDESTRTGCILAHLNRRSETDKNNFAMQRNTSRRSLTQKKSSCSDVSLEERIKLLTCNIDEVVDEADKDTLDENMDKTIGGVEFQLYDESGNQNTGKIANEDSEKVYSPASSACHYTCGSRASTKLSDIFQKLKTKDIVLGVEGSTPVFMPEQCQCPVVPDLGMGGQVPFVHTETQRNSSRLNEPKRQFFSTISPLTACVVGNKDDISSYYTLASTQQIDRNENRGSFSEIFDAEESFHTSEISDTRVIAPDVVAGTPGQRQDDVRMFVQLETSRSENLSKCMKKDAPNLSSDDEGQNDYGFNKRPFVRGIEPKKCFKTEVVEAMQEQLQQHRSRTGVSTQCPMQRPQNLATQNIQMTSFATWENNFLKECSQASPNTVPEPYPQQEKLRFYSEDGTCQKTTGFESGSLNYYETHPINTLSRRRLVQQSQNESLMLAQNCQKITSFGSHTVHSPTRRPESPPPLRNYNKTMVLVPYNAALYSPLVIPNIDPTYAQIQRQNILEYQQVVATKQTIRVPLSYSLPGLQLHVLSGQGKVHKYANSENKEERIWNKQYQTFTDKNTAHTLGAREDTEGQALISENERIKSTNVITISSQDQIKKTQTHDLKRNAEERQ